MDILEFNPNSVTRETSQYQSTYIHDPTIQTTSVEITIPLQIFNYAGIHIN
jgi:hypothetical protein